VRSLPGQRSLVQAIDVQTGQVRFSRIFAGPAQAYVRYWNADGHQDLLVVYWQKGKRHTQVFSGWNGALLQSS
jgi:hypothetical protein